MNDKELDEFLRQHICDIEKFSKLYCKNFNLEDFYSELLYDVYVYMKRYYDPKVQENPSVLFYSVVGILAKNVYRKFAKEQAKRNRQNKLINENFVVFDGDSPITIDDIMAAGLTDFERRIVSSIDYFCAFDKFTYKKVAEKLGIPQRVLYYYIYNIRKKVRLAIQSNKTS